MYHSIYATCIPKNCAIITLENVLTTDEGGTNAIPNNTELHTKRTGAKARFSIQGEGEK